MEIFKYLAGNVLILAALVLPACAKSTPNQVEVNLSVRAKECETSCSTIESIITIRNESHDVVCISERYSNNIETIIVLEPHGEDSGSGYTREFLPMLPVPNVPGKESAFVVMLQKEPQIRIPAGAEVKITAESQPLYSIPLHSAVDAHLSVFTYICDQASDFRHERLVSTVSY